MPASGPTRSVTIVFTDVEDSSAHWERLGDDFRRILAQHGSILREALAEAGGTEVKHQGDGFMLAFGEAAAAASFAVRAQQALAEHEWGPEVGTILVRMGMHTGEVIVADGAFGQPDYCGVAVNRAARVAEAAHGGQVLVSAASLEAVRDGLPD